jgi:hypothetical protein
MKHTCVILVILALLAGACAPIPTEIRVKRTITKAGGVVEEVEVYGSGAPRDSGYTHLDWAGVVKFTMGDSTVAHGDYGTFIDGVIQFCEMNPVACQMD